MPGGKRRGPGLGPWREFAARHRGNRHLKHDPLYSLSGPLIDALESEVPGLLTAEEAAFVRDLAEATGGGLFFRRRVVPCPLPAGPVAAQREGRQEQVRGAADELLGHYGVGEHRLGQFDRKQAGYDERADRRAAAFAGWLVSDPRFLTERDDLREREGSYVAERGRFPALPRSFLGERVGAADPREARYHLFFRRWNLCSFVTWDLPLPLWSEAGVTTLDTFTLLSAGVTVFVPWYVAQDGRFSLDELAGHLKSLHKPAHLKGWLVAPAGPSVTSATVTTSSSIASGTWSWGGATPTGWRARPCGSTACSPGISA